MQQNRKEILLKKYITKMPEKRGGAMPVPGPSHKRMGMGTGKPSNLFKSIKRLLAYIGKDRYKFIYVFLFLIGNSAATLAGSYILRPVINNLVSTDVTAHDRLVYLTVGVMVLLGIYTIGVVASYGQSRLMIGISQNALQRLRDDLFQSMQKLPIGFFDTNSNGELMSRYTNDVDAIGDMLNNTLVQLISGIISIVGTFVLMVYTNWILTIITVLTIPVLAKVGIEIASRSRKYYKGQQEALGAVNGCIEETVNGQKVVKVFCHEDQAIEDFNILSDHLCQEQRKAQFIGGIMGPVMGNLSQISYALTGIVGGILCVTKGFDIGGLSVFASYSRQFSRPVNEVSMQMNTIFSALAGAERVFDMMDHKPEEKDKEDAFVLNEIKGEVVVQDVSFGYHPDKLVLKNVSCYAKSGQKIAFVGSTGAGKTTITNLLNRFYDFKKGTITIDGMNIKDIQRDSLRKNIAMVLQDTHLFTGTVMENIRYGRLDATDEEVIQAAKTASAHSFIKRLVNGYQTIIEGDGANLSQGQRQLLNIARAAISKAQILVLDEATSSVDTRTEKHIEHGMERLMKERTTFVIAHRLSTVRNANAIMVLEDGRIIERGTHEELLSKRGKYYQLYTGELELD